MPQQVQNLSGATQIRDNTFMLNTSAVKNVLCQITLFRDKSMFAVTCYIARKKIKCNKDQV